MDLQKYATKSTKQATTSLGQYSVGAEAPTIGQIVNLKQSYKAPEEPGLIDKAEGRFGQAVKSLGKQQYPGQQVLGVTGALGGLVNDVLGAVISPAMDGLVDRISDNPFVQKIATSKTGSAITDASNSAVSAIGQGWDSFKEAAPGTAQMLTDAFNTTSILPTYAVGNEAKNLARDVATNVLKPSETAVQTKIISMFEKAVKPTAKKTAGAAEKYSDDVVTALKRISDDAPKLNIEDTTGELLSRAPQSLNELSQAIDQTKQLVFREYDSLAKQAGEQGVTLSADDIAKNLDEVISNKAMRLTNPEVIKYAENWASRLRDFGSFDAETAQEVIKTMNKNLESFYKNPTYESATKAAIDAGIVNNIRKALDVAIEGVTSGGYQDLKRVYGSLKAIENDVVRASMRDARKNVRGLLDYTDMLTGGQMVTGILSLNPAMFTKGAIERGFKEYIKFLNDPNRVIKSIFDVIERSKGDTAPQSRTMQFLNKQYPKGVPAGLSMKPIHADDLAFFEKVAYSPNPTPAQLSRLRETLAKGYGMEVPKSDKNLIDFVKMLVENDQHAAMDASLRTSNR